MIVIDNQNENMRGEKLIYHELLVNTFQVSLWVLICFKCEVETHM